MQELGGGGEPPRQLGLFTEPEKPRKSDKLNAALDKIAERFGNKAVTTADIAGSARRTPSVPRGPSARTDAARLENNVIPVDPEFPFLLSFLG